MKDITICGWTASRRSRLAALLGLAACGALVLAAGGCSSGQSRVMQIDAGTFQTDVLNSTQPVLVDFYKDGCPFCVALDPTMDELSKTYADRVKVCRFMIMTAYFTLPAPEIKDRYDIALVPTVVLFDKGKEVKRWAVIYGAGAYKPELDKVAPPVAATAKAN